MLWHPGATQEILMSFQVRPIAAAVVVDARARLAVGDPTVVHRVIAEPNSAPCRRCLRDGAPGDAMLLFAHSPFDTAGPYAETGPIFAHERCEGAALDAGELPEVTRTRAQAVVRVYDRRDAIHDAALTPSAEIAATLAHFFADDNVAYAHVRSATYGCFTYRVDRAG
jgi:Protein of unknown function (DUF1203)